MKQNMQVVDISDGSESDSEAEVPNTKRTPRGMSKRQRMTYDEDDSPDLDPDDTQVLSHYSAISAWSDQNRSEGWQAQCCCTFQLRC